MKILKLLAIASVLVLASFKAQATNLENGSGKCLDAHSPEVRMDGGRVQGYGCLTGQNQQWRMDAFGHLINVEGGKCVEINPDTLAAGANDIRNWSCNNGNHQRWRLEGNRIISYANNFCLDLYRYDPTVPNPTVVAQPCNNSFTQTWRFVDVVGSERRPAGVPMVQPVAQARPVEERRGPAITLELPQIIIGGTQPAVRPLPPREQDVRIDCPSNVRADLIANPTVAGWWNKFEANFSEAVIEQTAQNYRNNAYGSPIYGQRDHHDGYRGNRYAQDTWLICRYTGPGGTVPLTRHPEPNWFNCQVAGNGFVCRARY